jgi:hypothetical protein
VLYKTHQYQWHSETALFILNDQKLPDAESGVYPEDIQYQEKEAKLTFMKASCESITTNWSNVETLSALDHSIYARVRGMMDMIRDATTNLT